MSQSETNASYEKLLVVRTQGRDEQVFHELVARYERRMLYCILRRLGNDADLADVMQETWIRVFPRITTLRAPMALRIWPYKIAHDVALNQLRKDKCRKIQGSGDVHVADGLHASDWNELELLEHAVLVHKD
jgi:RNA polymerase sigma-70 factor (ECF subfamily)